MAILVSINPPHTNNIFDNIKGIEWRTKPMPLGKCFCYETKKCFGLGKVIGQFKIWRVKKYENISMIPEEYIELGCVPIEFLEAYSKGRPLYAHFIKRPKRYDKPRELSEFYTKCNEGCEDCHFWQSVRVNADEFDMECASDFYGHIPLKRPPISWCYVEARLIPNEKVFLLAHRRS